MNIRIIISVKKDMFFKVKNFSVKISLEKLLKDFSL